MLWLVWCGLELFDALGGDEKREEADGGVCCREEACAHVHLIFEGEDQAQGPMRLACGSGIVGSEIVRMAPSTAKTPLARSRVCVCRQLVCKTPSAQDYISTKHPVA